MSKYNFVKNCDIPEPPQSPIVVPDDSPINPLINLPPNPTIPLELIAKFLPCKYKGRYPCPEIKVESMPDQPGGNNNSVTYNCENKSELIVDFDIESYCCDVIEDENGNEIDHDKIVMTSRAELTLPYPPTIASGLLYYFDYTTIANYIATYNASHTDQLSLCDRCWTQEHLSNLRNLGGNPSYFRWYVYTYDDTQHDLSDKQYLYPLINPRGNYFGLASAFKYEERITASLDHCVCKARILSYYTECVAVIGYVCGTCDQSYAQITGPADQELPEPTSPYAGLYEWGIEPDYPVSVGAAFTGYLSKRDHKVYSNVPREEEKKYIGQGTYTGNGYVENITWRPNIDSYDPTYSSLSTTAEIDYYNTSGEIPAGATVTVEKQCETCGNTEKNTVSDAEYKRVYPAAALTASNTYGAEISINLYSGSGSAGPVVTAFNYAGPVQVGDRGMASYSNGKYHFFKRSPADQEPGPVIRKGLRKHFSGLNGFAIASDKIDSTELTSLTSAEQNLLIMDSEYSTVQTISKSGVAEIDTINVEFTADRSVEAPNYLCGYWAQKSIDGDPFNHDIDYVRGDAEHVIGTDANSVERDVPLSETELKQDIHVMHDTPGDSGYDTISNVSYNGLLYGGSAIYGPYGEPGSGNSGNFYYWGGRFGPLGVVCGSRTATLVDASLSGNVASRYLCTYRAYDENHNEICSFNYNPLINGYETTYSLLKDSYEVKADGLYKRKVPERCYTVEGNYLKNKSNIGNTTSVKLKDLLQDTTYRIGKGNSSQEYRFYPGKLILKDASSISPEKASSDETYYYTPQQDPRLEETVTFAFTMSNMQDREYTPLTIFNFGTGGWYNKKNIVTYNNQKVIIDANSIGFKPFGGRLPSKEMLYYWVPNKDIASATYTFKEFFKPNNDFLLNGETKTISLTGNWYPVEYDSTLGRYVLSIGNYETRCYALYSSQGNIALDQAIHFTFTKAQGVDVTLSIDSAIQQITTINWFGNEIRTKPNTPYYWACPDKTIACNVMPQLPELVVVADPSTGSFTGYYWKIVSIDND